MKIYICEFFHFCLILCALWSLANVMSNNNWIVGSIESSQEKRYYLFYSSANKAITRMNNRMPFFLSWSLGTRLKSYSNFLR